MGCPENLRAVKCYNVYNTTGADSLDLFSYGDKMQITLAPLEMKIFQFGDRDNRCLAPENTNDFTLSFTVSNNADAHICKGKDVAIWIANGVLHGTFGGCKIKRSLRTVPTTSPLYGTKTKWSDSLWTGSWWAARTHRRQLHRLPPTT